MSAKKKYASDREKVEERLPRSVREAKSIHRLRLAAAKRQQAKALFYQKLAARKGLRLEAASCQIGSTQVVDKVVPAGHGWFYTSKVCAGCTPGQVWLKSTAARSQETGRYYKFKVKEEDFPELPSLCSVMGDCVLFTDAEEPVPGQLIVATGLLR